MTAIVLTLLLAQAAPETPVLETRTRSVALFKNGVAFHVREGTCPPGATAADLARLPLPAHGSFWISTDPGRLRLVEAVASREKRTETVTAVDLEGMLRANAGKEVIVHLPEAVRGMLLRVTEAVPPAAPELPWIPRIPPPAHDLVVLKTSGGELAIPRPQIQRLASVTGSLADRYDRTLEGTRLRLKLEPRGDGPSPVVVSYLARGTSWAPSYAVDITEPGKARLSAKAEVFCEAEEIDGATFWFVTGFPNLKFRDIGSPVGMQGSLADFLQALMNAGRPQAEQAQTMAQRAIWSNVAEFEAGEVFPVMEGPAAGEGEEDLFFYERRGVTLRRGERGYYPLFTSTVPFEHLYEWFIPDTLSGGRRPGPREDEKPEVVWHSLRLTNDTKTPWTTAPALTLKNDRVLGQDVLRYAAPGAKTVLRITQALDLRAAAEEVETERSRNAATFHRTSYDLVTVKGELGVTNHKGEEVVVEATKMLSGELVERPEGAEATVLARGLREVNPTVRLVVRLRVPPGGTVKAAYVYRLYVRG